MLIHVPVQNSLQILRRKHLKNSAALRKITRPGSAKSIKSSVQFVKEPVSKIPRIVKGCSMCSRKNFRRNFDNISAKMAIPRDEKWDTNEDTWDDPLDASTAVPVEDNAFQGKFSDSGLLKFQQKAAAPVQTRCICGTALDVHVCTAKADNGQSKEEDQRARYYSRLEELMTKHAVKWSKVEDGPGFQVSGSRDVGKVCKLALAEFVTDKKPSDDSTKVNGDSDGAKAQQVPERRRAGIYPA